MASIDFPNSPTDGQTFTAGNATYTYIASKGYWDAVTTTVGIQLTDLSVGAENPADGDGAIAYDNSTGVFTYTPPVISAGGIALTDLSVGAENPADGDGAIAYDNSTGVFTYTPPVISAGSSLPSQTGKTGAFLTTDGSSASWDTLVSTTSEAPQLASTIVNPNDYGTSASDQFGRAVTTDGTNVYVVASESDAPNAGSVVYVYNASTKAYLYTVTAPIVTNGFAGLYARAADGYLVVPTEDSYITPPSGNNIGRVHIFNSADGSFVRTISRVGTSTSFSPVGNDLFGYTVGTANGKTIVGAYYGGLEGATRPAGEALLYDNATGSLLHTFSNPSSPVVDGDDFGRAVAMANNYILIGAMGEDQAGSNWGVVYVYDATTYALIRTISPSAGIFLGWDIVLDTTGEYFYSPFSSSVGKVYEIATGTVALTISTPAGATAAWGVNGFAMTEEYVIIADPSYNTYGRVHYYNKTTGVEVFTVDSPASTGTMGLGYHSITSVGTSVFVSNKNATGDGNTNSGEIYVIEPLVTRTFSDDVAFTGAVTIGGVAPLTLTDLSVGAENPADGDGAIAYDNSTGVFTYTPPVISGGVDTASVEAAGALMDSELTNIVAVKALDQGVATTDSPSFAGLDLSGIPTAPTAAAGTNTTQIATTEFTTTALANLVDTAPTTLDTLNELAAALGDDPNFATTITNSIALKAPLNTPSFTGPVTVTGTTTLDGITTLSTSTEITALPGFSLGFVYAQQDKIEAGDAQTGDLFGISTSISSTGDTAIVGSPFEDTNGASAGAAYIYVRDGLTWSQQAKIQSIGILTGDLFGYSVSISDDGNTAIIGAYGEDTGASAAGAAYIFIRSGTTWSQQAKIQASVTDLNAQFGYSVSISGDGLTAIIGAYLENEGATSDCGAAYVFTKSGSTWSQQVRLLADTLGNSNQFGISVSISDDGNTAVVGSRYEANTGVAYVFTRSDSTWSQQAKIQASDIEASDDFGQSVSISNDGNTVIVGSPLEDTGGSSAGAAYIFTRSESTWSQQAKVQASDAEAGDNFGQSVGISGDGLRVVVGAYNEDTGASNAGAAYVFTKSGSTWSQAQKIQAPSPAATDLLGWASSISNDGSTILVGNRNEDPSGVVDAGAAYIFTAAPSGTDFTHDVSESSVFLHSALTADFTANFSNVPTTANRTLSVALIISQGATGYLPTAVQIDGAAQTILWQGASAPTSTPSATDIVSFTFIRSAGAWTVLGTVTAFGLV